MRRPRLRVLPRWAFLVTRAVAGFEPAAVTKPPWGISFNRDWWDRATVGARLRVLRHEMAHWRQYEELGLVRFYGLYLLMSLNHDYATHPMEEEARDAE